MKTTEVLSELKRRFPNEPEYHQAVDRTVVHSRQNVFISGNLGR